MPAYFNKSGDNTKRFTTDVILSSEPKPSFDATCISAYADRKVSLK